MTSRKVMLITGTRKGIGRFLAEHYVENGYVVEGCSRQPVDWEVENYNHHTVDITEESQIKGMFAAIVRRHGRLDVAINKFRTGEEWKEQQARLQAQQEAEAQQAQLQAAA